MYEGRRKLQRVWTQLQDNVTSELTIDFCGTMTEEGVTGDYWEKFHEILAKNTSLKWL